MATFQICNGTSLDQNPKSVQNWVKKLNQATQKVTKLHFYFHRLRGTSAVAVAQANSTDSSPTLFGLVYIKDDPLTVGPELSSELIGYAQGITASASLEELI
ncbi:UNVERIFIED_CONTAM: Dirigent protein 21 [Sesamum calycinum]|uniref:Dirigent protein n=1 Tax=Sesamum calycinum TaxID=2727403 RepID=A0AAW2RA93_9LAMI